MAEETGVDSGNILPERKLFLEKLQKEVDYAYDHRAIETEAEGLDMPRERLEGMEEFAQELRGKKDDEIIDYGPFQKAPCEVVVYNPEDYKALVEMSVRKFWNDDEFVKSETAELVQHEVEHYQALSGLPGVKHIFGVHFFQIAGTNKINFTRFYDNEGKIPVGLIIKSFFDVETPSAGDALFQSHFPDYPKSY